MHGRTADVASDTEQGMVPAVHTTTCMTTAALSSAEGT